MSWFHDDRRKHDRQREDARAQRLATLHKALAHAVTEALATDAVVQQVVWELAQLDVKADVTTVVEMTYEPLLSRRTGPAATATGADMATLADAGLSMGDAVPLVDDADRVRLHGLGISTEQ